MSLSTYGWIEVRNEYDGIWHGAIKLTPQTFPWTDHRGIRKDLNELAVGNGMPIDASEETKEFWNSDGFMRPQWIMSNKVWQVNWELLTEEWLILFNFMKVLADYHGEDKVRLVFWSD